MERKIPAFDTIICSPDIMEHFENLSLKAVSENMKATYNMGLAKGPIPDIKFVKETYLPEKSMLLTKGKIVVAIYKEGKITVVPWPLRKIQKKHPMDRENIEEILKP